MNYSGREIDKINFYKMRYHQRLFLFLKLNLNEFNNENPYFEETINIIPKLFLYEVLFPKICLRLNENTI